jgi:hypothetical protein
MPTLRQFELLDDLKPFESARAVLLKWDGQKYARTDERIEVYEFIGIHGHRGDRGFARHSDESQKWEVMSGMQEAVSSWLPY